MPYIIKNGIFIANIDTDLKNGTEIRYSRQKTKNALNANREFDLVNSSVGRISRAKKYYKISCEIPEFALEINEKEFYII